MKLATLREGNRDGVLVVVSRDLSQAVRASDIVPTMQALLDDWDKYAPALEALYAALNDGAVEASFPFDSAQMMAPLPRSYHWVDGGGYMPHMTLMRESRGASMPPEWETEPLFYQGNGDGYMGPHDPILARSEDWGIDLEGEVAVFLDGVDMASTEDEIRPHIKLVAIMNDISMRFLIPPELKKGFGFYQSKTNKAFSPVAVTPDELDAWDGDKLNLPLHIKINDEWFGECNAGVDFQFGFPEVIKHAVKTRFMGPGTIVGSGTVSNWDRTKGSACLNEKRMLEKKEFGEIRSDFLKFGDRVHIEMVDDAGNSIFGAIDHEVVKYER